MFYKTDRFDQPSNLIQQPQKSARVGGVVRGFQITSNLARQLGDLTGSGDQPSGKVVHKD